MESCPCGLEKNYNECCQPVISGDRVAATAEELMRSRYSAYTKAELDHIFNTTHPDQREDYDHEGTKDWAENAKWHGLTIAETENGGSDDEEGMIEFIAKYTHSGIERNHHERSVFEKVEGVWYFKDGQLVPPKQVVREGPKVGRNDPCICGSGKKYKKCCMRKN